MPRKKGEKPIFKDFVICTAGDLGRGWTDDQIQSWIKLRDGTLVQEMDGSVTHLLCTVEDFRKKRPKVTYALNNLKKQCFIVTSDWLEDSIHKKKKLSEKRYLVQAAYKEEQAKKAQELKAMRAAQPIEEPKNFVSDKLYHVYSDSTYFRYEVTLTRVNAEHPDNEELNERYILYLWESNAKPHSYACASKYFKKAGAHPCYWRASPCDRKFDVEFREFQDFFKKKTNIDWMERLAKAGTRPMTSFHYQPPTGGKPVGVVTGKYANFVYQSDVAEAKQSTKPGSGNCCSEMQIDTASGDLTGREKGPPDPKAQQGVANLRSQHTDPRRGLAMAEIEDIFNNNIAVEVVHRIVEAAIRAISQRTPRGAIDQTIKPPPQNRNVPSAVAGLSANSPQHDDKAQSLTGGVAVGEVHAMEGVEVAQKGHQNQTIVNNNVSFVEQKTSCPQVVNDIEMITQESELKDHSNNAGTSDPAPTVTVDNTTSPMSEAAGKNAQTEMAQDQNVPHTSTGAMTFDGSGLKVSTNMLYYTTDMW